MFRVSDAASIADDVVAYVRDNDLDLEEAQNFAEMVRNAALNGFEELAWPRRANDA